MEKEKSQDTTDPVVGDITKPSKDLPVTETESI
mgnify:CR=1 FL=1